MAHELLGESFDIHGGGLDLQFPHHENEIAQSACAHPHGDFAHYWLHNEMLQVEGKKMSKSLGNFFTVRDLLDQGIKGDVIRHVFLQTHYRSPMDWTAEKAKQAKQEVFWWQEATASARSVEPPVELIDALADDLNTHAGLTAMRKMYREGRFEDLRASMKILGFGTILESVAVSVSSSATTTVHVGQVEVRTSLDKTSEGELLSTFANDLSNLRTAAMASKDFSAVDALKASLIAAGVEVRMSKAGVELVPGPDFDPAKLEALQ